MTRLRPCIDLHAGQVKQIVGGTLSSRSGDLKTNHVSEYSASHFARIYKENDLRGAHLILLGPGNENAAHEALREWPSGLQVGGGITANNAQAWIDSGASKVIVTSYLFPEAKFSQQRVEEIFTALGGDRERLVIDLSCRKEGDRWIVAVDKWQTKTDTEVNLNLILRLEPYCSEFLIHAADNEGLQGGIDEELVNRLGQWCSIPVTYAGGSKSLSDLDLVNRLSSGRVDLTIGSALDIFGGTAVSLKDCVAWNNAHFKDALGS